MKTLFNEQVSFTSRHKVNPPILDTGFLSNFAAHGFKRLFLCKSTEIGNGSIGPSADGVLQVKAQFIS